MRRIDILNKASEIVMGQREQDYGSPEDNFGLIARLWNDYMGDILFSPKDVVMCMILLKVARGRGDKPTDDTFIDIAGYAACAGEVSK